ncbi:hypothetical protein IW261DRAFT_1632060, partial [Armillaria novae-zelandiae]
MVVEWGIMRDTCDYGCPEVNIFFDTNLSPSDDKRDHGYPSNNRPTEPIFVWNATGTTSSNVSSYDVLRNAPRFTTHFIIYPVCEDFQKSLLIRHATRAYYPFDWYWSGVTAFAQETFTNKSVALALSSAFRFVGTSFSNLAITTGVQEADPAHLGDAGIKEEIIFAYVILKRRLITLMICLITVATVIFGFRQRNEIAVVPIGTLFAFTQLRSTMPGAHEGFGDILGASSFILVAKNRLTSSTRFNWAIAMPDLSVDLRGDNDWHLLICGPRRYFSQSLHLGRISELAVKVLHFYISDIWNTANVLAQDAGGCTQTRRKQFFYHAKKNQSLGTGREKDLGHNFCAF